jgi:hypothetical protein
MHGLESAYTVFLLIAHYVTVWRHGLVAAAKGQRQKKVINNDPPNVEAQQKEIAIHHCTVLKPWRIQQHACTRIRI